MNSHNSNMMDQEEIAKMLLNAPTAFDDVLPQPVRISLIEFHNYTVEVNGVEVIRRKPIQRIAEINTYVPLAILHRMMAGQEKIKRLQKLRSQQGDDTAGQQELMAWMTEQVLSVWKLTEPEMTLDGLIEGLDFKKVFGLFNLFFGNLLQGLNK